MTEFSPNDTASNRENLTARTSAMSTEPTCLRFENMDRVDPGLLSFPPHQLFAWTSPLASRSGGRRRVSTRRSPPRFVTVPSLCPLTLLSPPLPPCFISSVYRRVAAGLGDSNRWLWVSTASLERWRGRGEPDLSWRRRQAGRSRVSHGVDLGQISPGGFAGVALRRCLCRSGQYSASTVSPMSPLTAALVRTSPSCSKLKRRFETHRRGLLSRWVSPPVSPAVRSSGSSVLQASEGSWSSSSASLGVLLLESLVLCSRGGTRVQPLNLCFHQPQRLEWTSLLAMAGPGLADPASHVLLSMLPSGWSAVPRTILRLRFSIGPSYFDAGSGFKISSLVSCLLNGCLKTC
ncbi:hypothetical protein Bca101_048683 [Brassica carinata]